MCTPGKGVRDRARVARGVKNGRGGAHTDGRRPTTHPGQRPCRVSRLKKRPSSLFSLRLWVVWRVECGCLDRMCDVVETSRGRSWRRSADIHQSQWTLTRSTVSHCTCKSRRQLRRACVKRIQARTRSIRRRPSCSSAALPGCACIAATAAPRPPAPTARCLRANAAA